MDSFVIAMYIYMKIFFYSKRLLLKINILQYIITFMDIVSINTKIIKKYFNQYIFVGISVFDFTKL